MVNYNVEGSGRPGGFDLLNMKYDLMTEALRIWTICNKHIFCIVLARVPGCFASPPNQMPSRLSFYSRCRFVFCVGADCYYTAPAAFSLADVWERG